MDDYLTKPYDYAALMSAIKRWINLPAQSFAGVRAVNTCNSYSLPDQVDGLDIESGVTRLLRDTGKYIELLELFKKITQCPIFKIRQYLEDEDTDSAIRLLHTLKGVSGNLGAVKVQQAAASFESYLENNNCSDYEAQLKLLESCLNDTFNSICNIIHSNNSIGSIQPEESYCIKEKLEDLESLIEINDTSALDLFKELSPYLNIYHKDAVLLLKDALYNFDWNSALNITKGLAKQT